MKNFMILILCIIACFYQKSLAQDTNSTAVLIKYIAEHDTSHVITENSVSKTCLMLDSVSFNDSLVLSKILRQHVFRIMDCTKKGYDTLPGYGILSYDFTYLCKARGYGTITIKGNRLEPIIGSLSSLKSGDFIQFEHIEGFKPNGEKFALPNMYGVLK